MEPNKQAGLVTTVVIIIVALLVLSYMGISVRDVAQSPAGQSNFGYMKEITVAVWQKYLAEPAKYLYNDIFVDLIWNPFVKALKDIKGGQPTSIEPSSINYTPQVQ